MPNADAPLSAEEAQALFAPFRAHTALAIGVSGGPDSVALLALLARHGGFALHPATVDHGLRPDAAREAEQVAALCASLNLPHTTLLWKGDKPKTGLQEKARAARRALLLAHANDKGASGLMLAHTRDDQAETVLMRLCAGSGLAGLAGMNAGEPAPNGISVLRPLLTVPKSRLIATCRALGLPFLTDPSNSNELFARARLRRIMGPLAREGLSADRLLTLAERARAAQNLIEAQADTALTALHLSDGTALATLDLTGFTALPGAVRVQILRRLVEEHGTESAPRLARIEALDGALTAQSETRRTLAGLLFDAKGSHITVYHAPPRRSPKA